MPDVVGKTLSEACAELKNMGLNVMFEQDGEYVVGQMPLKDTRLFLGEMVYLSVY